jgi:hypothetical protein
MVIPNLRTVGSLDADGSAGAAGVPEFEQAARPNTIMIDIATSIKRYIFFISSPPQFLYTTHTWVEYT